MLPLTHNITAAMYTETKQKVSLCCRFLDELAIAHHDHAELAGVLQVSA